MKNVIHKVISIALAILYYFFGDLQFNDPDPWLWVSAYWLLIVIALLEVFNKRNYKLNMIVLIIYSIWGATFIPDFINWAQIGFPAIAGEMSEGHPYIEVMREFIGLLIAIAGLVYWFMLSKKKY